MGIGKLSNLRFSEENVSKESANLLFLFVELHSAMYTLSLFVHELRLALQMYCFLAASTALSKAATRAEIRYVKVINLRVISINLLVVLLELVMLFN